MTFQKDDLVGKYKIKKKIGQGGFGAVYLADEVVLKRETAIKSIGAADANDLKAKIDEAQIQHKCKHDCIVALNEVNVYGFSGNLWLILDVEYIAGGSLEGFMSKRFVSAVEARKAFSDVLYGLDWAHNQGVIHRDIKLGNILLSSTNAKLSDFGLAELIKQKAAPYGGKVYTSHAAPEMYGGSKTSVLTDIYAMGLTLFRAVNNYTDWHMRLGKLKNWQEVAAQGNLLKKIGYQRFVSGKIRRVINKACNADPASRFQSASDMREAIDKLNPGVSWVRQDKMYWAGELGGKTYSLNIALGKRCKVEYRVNGRRQSNLCKTFDTQGDANRYLEDVIAQQSIC